MTGYRITRSGSIAAPTSTGGSYRPISPDRVRQVWAVISRTPTASVRSIGHQIGLHYSRVESAIQILVRVGYVELVPGSTGRRVVVPLLVSRRIKFRRVSRPEVRHAA